ncbi:MAG: amino acid ABC transporter substrate-binding protein [Coriobacteriales bacterium]|nr:amino acid ABC transporter substrate-binding protein [Coriobacteriales bacterium]
MAFSQTGLTRRQLVGFAAMAAVVAPFALAGCTTTDNDKKEEKKEETPADDAKDEAPADDKEAAEYTLVSEGKLTFASSPDYPPFENLAEDGETYVGFEVDLIQEICKRMGLECVIKPLQFDAIIPAIVQGGQYDVGVSGFSVTPDRKKEIDFTEAYYTDDMAVIVTVDSDITAENVREELNKSTRTIVAQSGTTGETYAKENFPEATVKGLGGANDTFAALQASQADAICTNNSVAADVIKSYPEQHIIMREATGEDYAMVVSKENPGLTAAISAVIKEMKEDGKLDELLAAWNLNA